MSRHFENWIDGYLEYAENTEPARIFHHWCAISAIAAALRRKTYLQWHTKIFPNMYVVLVSPPGGRKGTAMGPVQAMLEDINIKMAAEAITREALIRELKNSTESVMKDDGTVEHHSSLTIFSPELSVFLGGSNNLQLLSDLCDWFDCRKKWEYRTKNMGVDTINGVWVNLIGATTPDIVRSALPQDAIGGGLTSRIIFVYAPGKEKIVHYPFPTPDELYKRELLVQDLENIAAMQGPFKMDEECFKRWYNWYEEHEKHLPFDSPMFAGYNERKPLHTLKLSMIMSAARSSDAVITLRDLNRASSLLGAAEAFMPRVFEGYGKVSDSDVIRDIMNVIASVKVITFGELVNKFLLDTSKERIEEILDSLETFNFCRRVIKGRDIVIEFIKKDPQAPNIEH